MAITTISILLLALLLVTQHGPSSARIPGSSLPHISNSMVRTVTVAKYGARNFTTLQAAINWVPPNNKQWIRIHVKPGTYQEKVYVPAEKQFIYLEGEDRRRTVIEWGGHGAPSTNSTFTLMADNLLVSRMTFKNTFNVRIRNPNYVEQAPAMLVWGDKVAFYNCAFISLQDTLADWSGRHLFQSCYIEGATDFIWGHGQSLYKDCEMYSTAQNLGEGRIYGYVTAQGRDDPSEGSAFVFDGGAVTGKGLTYLGRAYRQYSTVIFSKTFLTNVVLPKGWDAWSFIGKEYAITYVESGCMGPGAYMSQRVSWEKKPEAVDLNKYLDRSKFIDQEGWIDQQPMHN